MKKRNYAKERREAKSYADRIMDTGAGSNLKPHEFATRWGIAYNAYLAGMRRPLGERA